jgi:hypothetical protein
MAPASARWWGLLSTCTPGKHPACLPACASKPCDAAACLAPHTAGCCCCATRLRQHTKSSSEQRSGMAALACRYLAPSPCHCQQHCQLLSYKPPCDPPACLPACLQADHHRAAGHHHHLWVLLSGSAAHQAPLLPVPGRRAQQRTHAAHGHAAGRRAVWPRHGSLPGGAVPGAPHVCGLRAGGHAGGAALNSSGASRQVQCTRMRGAWFCTAARCRCAREQQRAGW